MRHLARGEYTTNQVAKISGATLRQLQFLDEQGYVRPTIRGTWRVWPRTEVELALVLSQFKRKGLNPSTLRRFNPNLRSILRNRIKGEAVYIIYSEGVIWSRSTLTHVVDDLIKLDAAACVVSVSDLL